jgi:hypothetical protein
VKIDNQKTFLIDPENWLSLRITLRRIFILVKRRKGCRKDGA